jgi:hypothetical protein
MVDRAELIVVVVNLVLGLSCAVPLAKRLVRLGHSRWQGAGSYLMLLTVYFVESVGFMAGMATNGPGIVLALVWGLIFGYWIRGKATQPGDVVTSAAFLALYSSLPAVSLLSVPIVMRLGGWSVLSVESGARFGVPTMVPWPANTILGFCVLVAVVAVILKGAITTGAVYFLCRSGRSLRHGH